MKNEEFNEEIIQLLYFVFRELHKQINILKNKRESADFTIKPDFLRFSTRESIENFNTVNVNDEEYNKTVKSNLNVIEI